MNVGALVVLAFLGNGLIYTGLALINARLWPSALSGSYAATSVGVRIAIMEVLVIRHMGLMEGYDVLTSSRSVL